jgi:hypothetical protein
MEIIEANLLNLPRCIEVGERDYRELFGKDDFDFPYSLGRWAYLLKSDQGAAFYVEYHGQIVGMICGCSSISIDTGKAVATVMHWYVDKRANGYGIRLLWRFKRWAKAKGCASLVLTCSPETWDEKHAALYGRMGCKDYGRKFIMEKI